MAYLRLVSSHTEAEFAITSRSLDGYFVDSMNQSLTLYTGSHLISLENTEKNHWDNWDEFVEQVKAQFEESNDDF